MRVLDFSDGFSSASTPTVSTATTQTTFTIANNQASPANVTGLSFSSASHRGAIVEYDITRKTATASSEVRAIGSLILVYRTETSSWSMEEQSNHDDVGVTFTVTAGGQVQYTSTNISGSSYVGTMNFFSRVFNA